MTLTISAQIALFGVLGGLTLACSDDGGSTPGAGGSSAGTPNGGSSAGVPSTAGASGSETQAGSGMGGNPGLGGSGGAAGSGGVESGGMPSTGGGGMAGSGGMAGGGGGGMVNASGGAPTGPASGRQTARPTGSMPGAPNGYWEYLPPHYGNGDLYPLIVFDHGLAENGNGSAGDLNKLLKHGPPMLISKSQWPESRRFIVLSPQQGNGCPTADQVDKFLTFAVGAYQVDPKRIYLTGLSCGGSATWNYLGDHTNERVAAAVPICGVGNSAFQKAGCAMGKVPIWSFVGDKDNDGNIRGSTDPIRSLEACMNPAAVDVKITTYPGVGHEAWPPVYAVTDPAVDIYDWMLKHPKP